MICTFLLKFYSIGQSRIHDHRISDNSDRIYIPFDCYVSNDLIQIKLETCCSSSGKYHKKCRAITDTIRMSMLSMLMRFFFSICEIKSVFFSLVTFLLFRLKLFDRNTERKFAGEHKRKKYL